MVASRMQIAENKKPRILLDAGLNLTRQLATLPTDDSVSTIAGRGLNFRIRNGNGCDPSPMATERCLTVLVISSAKVYLRTLANVIERLLPLANSQSNKSRVRFS